MSADDITQIIDRLDRIETKQDKQGDAIANIRVALAERNGEKLGVQAVKGSVMTKIASYGGLMAGIGAMLAIFLKK